MHQWYSWTTACPLPRAISARLTGTVTTKAATSANARLPRFGTPGRAHDEDSRCGRHPGFPVDARNRRSRRLLVTTKTELNAMAAPATSGFSRPDAASGRAATL